jgi:DNA mismatch endonuclease (patch repair protein)
MDKHSKEVRSFNMSQVKSKDTKPEILVRKFLFSKGLRYRLYDKKISGKPDIVFQKYRTVVFIQGCFWHGHENCKHASIPKTRTEFWLNKIEGNINRDKTNIEKLTNEGWNVLQVFTCALKKDKREQTLNNVLKNIKVNLQVDL